MRGTKLLGMLAIASIAVTPVMAANQASPLSVASKLRAAPRAKKSSNLAGAALVLVVVAGAAGIAGIVAAADGGNSASS